MLFRSIGIQMASAYLGSTFMPPVFGLIANHISIRLMPLYALFFIPASNEPSGCLQTFGDCRKGQIPRCSAALQV